jgi:hypothetical protein
MVSKYSCLSSVWTDNTRGVFVKERGNGQWAKLERVFQPEKIKKQFSTLPLRCFPKRSARRR